MTTLSIEYRANAERLRARAREIKAKGNKKAQLDPRFRAYFAQARHLDHVADYLDDDRYKSIDTLFEAIKGDYY